MSGRGTNKLYPRIVYTAVYIKNGYYIDGLLVWGQIFYTNSKDLVIYEEIDNTDDIDTIKKYGKHTSI